MARMLSSYCAEEVVTCYGTNNFGVTEWQEVAKVAIQQGKGNRVDDSVAMLQATLATEIPITQHLGLRVARYDADGLALAAPLAPNINHKETVFAGSLNAVLTLTGWSLLWLILFEEAIAAKVVIQDSTVRYLRPVVTDFVARCPQLEPNGRTRLLTTLRRHGRSRVTLDAAIYEGDEVAVAFTGRYVLLKA